MIDFVGVLKVHKRMTRAEEKRYCSSSTWLAISINASTRVIEAAI